MLSFWDDLTGVWTEPATVLADSAERCKIWWQKNI
jgi:hypothetical protein